MKFKKLVALFGALQELDKCKLTKLSVKTVIALAQNVSITKPIAEEYNTSRNLLLSGYEKQVVDGSREAAEVNSKLQEVLETEKDVKLQKIKVSDLGLGENIIPFTVIEGLSPILEDFETFQ